MGSLLLRAPDPKLKPQVDPRAAPGHRDPLYKVPETGAPVIEQVTEGTRSISWSWEVERPGTQFSGGAPFRQQVYWATFEVDADGVMRVSARMVSASGQFRAPEWTLRDKFKEALEVFKLGGVEVAAFEAEWGYMGPGEISHNLDAFFGHLAQNPGRRLEAARATPSGKVAVENGFTDVQFVSEPGYEPSEVTGHTGVAEARPVVRVRFAVQGAQASKPISGNAKAPKPGSTPTPGSSTQGGGSGGTKGGTYSTGQRITAAAAAAAIAANAVGNAIINYQNKRDIRAYLDRNEATLQAEQASNPELGFLMVTRFTGGVDSGEGATAAARFAGMTWYRGETEYDAKAMVKDMTAGVTYSFAWIPPLEPVSDWGKAGLAMFADVAKMEFQRLGFAQLGGFKVKRRSYPANLSEKAQKWAKGLRFHVLKPPSKVTYRGVRGGNETESLTLSERDVIDGKVTAIMIDGDPIVPVIAADPSTSGFFRADADIALDHSGVVKERNIDDFRWLTPDQIEMVNGPYRQFVDYTKKNPDWREQAGFPKPAETGDPGSLEWDRIKGEWRQKRKH